MKANTDLKNEYHSTESERGNAHPHRKATDSWKLNTECSEILRPLTRNIDNEKNVKGTTYNVKETSYFC